jgi:hypothetical protein
VALARTAGAKTSARLGQAQLYVPAACRWPPYTFTREKIGTRYVTLGVRILVDPADPEESGQPWLKTTGCPVPQSL